MKLNLGCCDRLVPGFIGVDLMPPAQCSTCGGSKWVKGTSAYGGMMQCPKCCGDDRVQYQQVDLAGPWPWGTSSVEEVLAYDVIEHIGDCMATPDLGHPFHPRGVNGRIHFMNELHRVMKPGARVTIETPNAARGVGYFQDPTHVSPWCMSTFKYFEHGSFAHTRLAKPYGITAAFRIVEILEHPSPAEGFGEQVWKIRAILEAVK